MKEKLKKLVIIGYLFFYAAAAVYVVSSAGCAYVPADVDCEVIPCEEDVCYEAWWIPNQGKLYYIWREVPCEEV